MLAINAYIKKVDRLQTNHLRMRLKEQEKQEQMKLKIIRRKERIKIRAETNDIETKKIEKINKMKSWFSKI